MRCKPSVALLGDGFEISQVSRSATTLSSSLSAERLLEVNHRPGNETGDPLTQALNHPVGDATEGMLQWWFRTKPRDGQGLAPELGTIFSRLCDSEITAFRHARVWLAARAIALFRVDPKWTTSSLLPFFRLGQACR